MGSPPADGLPNMVTPDPDTGRLKNTPAPWVPYTRAGCDFGAVALANVVLENTGTGPNGDMTKVFGAGSPEWLEAQASNAAPAGTAARQLAQTDFVGIAIHCGAGGGICAGNPNARPDLLPDEPGGYNGFLGLFGAKYVNPAIAGGSAVVEQPERSADHGPVRAARVSRASTGCSRARRSPTSRRCRSRAFRSRSATSRTRTTSTASRARSTPPGARARPTTSSSSKNYDEAFGKFFDRLAAAGIDKSNTLFVFTVEEGDHFVGSTPTPADCDGVNTPCTYSLVGEVNGNLAGLLATQQGITTPFTVHADMAPTIYLTGNPSRTDPVTRAFGRALGQLTAVNPYTGQTDTLSAALADPVGMKALHMVTADPQRTPTLVMFAHPDYFLFAGAAELLVALHHRADDPADVHLRLEPRRHPAGDRDHLARHGRSGRAPPRGRSDVGGSHGHATDHAHAGRPAGYVRARWARAHRPARREGRAADAAGAPRDAATARTRSTSS